MSLIVLPPEEPADLEMVRALFVEYYATLEPEPLFDAEFAVELAGLPGAYAPPRGALLLARDGAEAAGCVALRPVGPDTGEVKRLYVRPAWRGRRLGHELVRRVLEEARRAGHRRACLDSLPTMTAALAVYQSFGFRPAAPYLERHAEGAMCFELPL
jgi:GNAT superfamily N-acetyltransferase